MTLPEPDTRVVSGRGERLLGSLMEGRMRRFFVLFLLFALCVAACVPRSRSRRSDDGGRGGGSDDDDAFADDDDDGNDFAGDYAGVMYGEATFEAETSSCSGVTSFYIDSSGIAEGYVDCFFETLGFSCTVPVESHDVLGPEEPTPVDFDCYPEQGTVLMFFASSPGGGPVEVWVDLNDSGNFTLYMEGVAYLDEGGA